MEREPRTSDTLRQLVRDLGDKLPTTSADGHQAPEVIIDLTEPPINGLISDLDKKLQARPASREPQIIPPRFSERIPTWLGFIIVTLVGVGLAVAAVRPWQARCTYGPDLCQVARLDIDALRITIPDSELMAMLPNIDELDPNDELTAGDIFAMERFADLNLEELLTAEEVSRLITLAD